MTDAKETPWRIRPLTWEKRASGEWIAKTVFGDFAAWLYHDQALDKFPWTAWEYQTRSGSCIARCLESLEEAQAAAEAWRLERLMMELEPVTRGE